MYLIYKTSYLCFFQFTQEKKKSTFCKWFFFGYENDQKADPSQWSWRYWLGSALCDSIHLVTFKLVPIKWSTADGSGAFLVVYATQTGSYQQIAAHGSFPGLT